MKCFTNFFRSTSKIIPFLESSFLEALSSQEKIHFSLIMYRTIFSISYHQAKRKYYFLPLYYPTRKASYRLNEAGQHFEKATNDSNLIENLVMKVAKYFSLRTGILPKRK